MYSSLPVLFPCFDFDVFLRKFSLEYFLSFSLAFKQTSIINFLKKKKRLHAQMLYLLQLLSHISDLQHTQTQTQRLYKPHVSSRSKHQLQFPLAWEFCQRKQSFNSAFQEAASFCLIRLTTLNQSLLLESKTLFLFMF